MLIAVINIHNFITLTNLGMVDGRIKIIDEEINEAKFSK